MNNSAKINYKYVWLNRDCLLKRSTLFQDKCRTEITALGPQDKEASITEIVELRVTPLVIEEETFDVTLRCKNSVVDVEIEEHNIFIEYATEIRHLPLIVPLFRELQENPKKVWDLLTAPLTMGELSGR